MQFTTSETENRPIVVKVVRDVDGDIMLTVAQHKVAYLSRRSGRLYGFQLCSDAADDLRAKGFNITTSGYLAGVSA